jgi:hypothetical protein
MAVTYESVIQKLNSFTLSNAANRAAAEAKVEEFMNDIRPEIDQVLRENPNLTEEQKRAFDEKEAKIFREVNTQFAQGGRRKTRAAKLRRRKQKKTRSHKKGTRKH